MNEKESVVGAVEELNHIGYHQDFKIENRYCVLLSEGEEEVSECDKRKQFNLTTTLINTNPEEASVLTSLQKDTRQYKEDSASLATGEDMVPTSLTEEELSTWTMVSLSCVKIC